MTNDRHNIDSKLISLREQIDRLKEGVDRCFIPGIYVHTWEISSIAKNISSNKLTESQKKTLDKLDEETLKQFRRLSEGRCSCKVSRDI